MQVTRTLLADKALPDRLNRDQRICQTKAFLNLPLPLESVHSRIDLIEYLHKAVIDHEGDGHVQTDSAHTRQGSLVEGFGTLVLQYRPGTVQRILVLGGV